MPQAIWNDQIIAKSEDTVEVEGNQYFPIDSVVQEFLKPSPTTTVCGWKGTASYYHLEVGGEVNADAAWYYADPKPEAENIRGYLAFWKGVRIEP